MAGRFYALLVMLCPLEALEAPLPLAQAGVLPEVETCHDLLPRFDLRIRARWGGEGFANFAHSK